MSVCVCSLRSLVIFRWCSTTLRPFAFSRRDSHDGKPPKCGHGKLIYPSRFSSFSVSLISPSQAWRAMGREGIYDHMQRPKPRPLAERNTTSLRLYRGRRRLAVSHGHVVSIQDQFVYVYVWWLVGGYSAPPSITTTMPHTAHVIIFVRMTGRRRRASRKMCVPLRNHKDEDEERR